jgi:hypothetical protein
VGRVSLLRVVSNINARVCGNDRWDDHHTNKCQGNKKVVQVFLQLLQPETLQARPALLSMALPILLGPNAAMN